MATVKSHSNSSCEILMAPLHGVTTRVMRESWYTRFSGIDRTVLPFILAVQAKGSKKNHFKDCLPPLTDCPLETPQILGNDAASFLETARTLHEAGYAEVNWNLGCPYPMVANKGRGSGLLPFPERIEAILNTVYSDSLFADGLLRLSVKTRLGRKSSAEFESVAKTFNNYPLSSVTIHPRVGTQMYRGEVDLEGFDLAQDLIIAPVIYNGDIRTTEDYYLIHKRFPNISAIMIGRGLLADPFLAKRIREAQSGEETTTPAYTSPQWVEEVHQWFQDIYASYKTVLYGPGHVLAKMKELFSYLAPSFPDKKKELEHISRSTSFEVYENAVSLFFTAARSGSSR